MNAMGLNVDAAALHVRIGSYDLTVMRITAKSVPHSRGSAGKSNKCGTGTQLQHDLAFPGCIYSGIKWESR